MIIEFKKEFALRTEESIKEISAQVVKILEELERNKFLIKRFEVELGCLTVEGYKQK